MTWVKIDDGFPDHPKIVGLSLRSKWMHIQGLCYAARFLTDGAVPVNVAKGWGNPSELLSAGLWVLRDAGHGYLIHDFLAYNPSREQVENDRRSSRERMRGVRQNTGSGRDGNVEEVFAAFWVIWPRRVGKRTAEKAMVAALKRATAPDILNGAIRYRDDPNRDPAFTKHPTTWLNGDCWLDETTTAAPPQPESAIHVAEEPKPEDLAAFADAVSADPWSQRKAAADG